MVAFKAIVRMLARTVVLAGAITLIVTGALNSRIAAFPTAAVLSAVCGL